MTKLRIGQGYDVHRLCQERALILGGVNVPYNRGLLGHSDADVLTHAIIDALLGAAGLGDIGTLFPDTDDAYKNADSLMLLRRALKAVEAAGFVVVNVDATLVAQAPKIAPYKEQMRQNIAAAIGVDASRVNVKATTEEKLGFTGDGSGMSAYAVALVESVQ
ncbi:MAG: 2-C-methyl-D-erythritol 2,4-cyclodiphosphate synthase [Oscillospiraceae bacterium]|nr:2-C-methyl-D-erythritol 2,4-cyclodiphosphate synthase [Oscillospiraceae bacterium]